MWLYSNLSEPNSQSSNNYFNPDGYIPEPIVDNSYTNGYKHSKKISSNNDNSNDNENDNNNNHNNNDHDDNNNNINNSNDSSVDMNNSNNNNTDNIISSNSSNFSNSTSIENNMKSKSNNSKPNDNGNEGDNDSLFIPFSIVGIVLLFIAGIIFSIYYIRKKSKKKQIEKIKEIECIEEEQCFTYPLPTIEEEIKEPIEECEEFINTLSRLRYKEPSLEYDPKNSLQPFYRYFQSPTVASITSCSSRRISNIVPPQPIMIDPQFEKRNSTNLSNNINHSFSTTQMSFTDMNTSNIEIIPYDDSKSSIDIKNKRNSS